MIHYQQSWSFRTSTLLVMVITVTSHYLSLWFNFNFDSSQVTCVGSSLHGDDYTTRFSSTTRLWTITYKADIVMSIAPLPLPSLSTYILSYTLFMMVIIILHRINCYYDTCDFDSQVYLLIHYQLSWSLSWSFCTSMLLVMVNNLSSNDLSL